uniref:Uncharacterized protein n=1 Tax=Trichuris muris TaxID=70415 RepID=A0A5S6R2T9_TRIMR
MSHARRPQESELPALIVDAKKLRKKGSIFLKELSSAPLSATSESGPMGTFNPKSLTARNEEVEKSLVMISKGIESELREPCDGDSKKKGKDKEKDNIVPDTSAQPPSQLIKQNDGTAPPLSTGDSNVDGDDNMPPEKPADLKLATVRELDLPQEEKEKDNAVVKADPQDVLDES